VRPTDKKIVECKKPVIPASNKKNLICKSAKKLSFDAAFRTTFSKFVLKKRKRVPFIKQGGSLRSG
jgi:hypothetical protein